jgi:hypothetical protein
MFYKKLADYRVDDLKKMYKEMRKEFYDVLTEKVTFSESAECDSEREEEESATEAEPPRKIAQRFHIPYIAPILSATEHQYLRTNIGNFLNHEILVLRRAFMIDHEQARQKIIYEKKRNAAMHSTYRWGDIRVVQPFSPTEWLGQQHFPYLLEKYEENPTGIDSAILFKKMNRLHHELWLLDQAYWTYREPWASFVWGEQPTNIVIAKTGDMFPVD